METTTSEPADPITARVAFASMRQVARTVRAGEAEDFGYRLERLEVLVATLANHVRKSVPDRLERELLENKISAVLDSLEAAADQA